MQQSINQTGTQMIQKPSVYCFLDQKKRIRPRSAGFSLIEILVAISIIALLLAIGTAVGLKASGEARREQTRQMMESLLAANDQYKAVRQTNIGVNSALPRSSTEQFVAACLTVGTCEEMMMVALNSSQSDTLDRIYKSGDGDVYKSVYDRWGTELEYRTTNDSTAAGGSGPANEAGDTVDDADLPTSRSPFFASAGPDKEWGTDDDITTLQQ